jgi:uncharacterized protein (TIGR02284 family)
MRAQETIRVLNRLIEVCRDGEEFCRVCARRRVGSDLRGLLRNRSDEWGRLGDELQALVLLLNGEPAMGGTLLASALRAGLVLRTLLAASAESEVIDAWRRMQVEALERYSEAMSGYLPERIRRTVGLQVDRISDRLQQIGTLAPGFATLTRGAPRPV